MNKKASTGFTLIEMLFVLMVLAIVGLFASMQYGRYQTLSYQKDAEVALLELAHRMEIYYAEKGSYKGTPFKEIRTQHYTLHVLKASANTYLLTANLIQSDNSSCQTLTLDNLGVKGDSLACWSI